VHYSSGPMNRCFYFLSQGTGTGNYASTYLPGGMTGIGNDKAGRIVYKALTAYMTSSTTYAGAKTACLNAAVALGYPVGSVEYTAVVNAFKAINVN
ncbi:MAG TPA: peptidase M4, partial [Holophagaceae bacterium]|nr:peptidase M4 [Holophagaceae bacterium]